MTDAANAGEAGVAVLDRLAGVCHARGIDPLAERIEALRAWIGADLVEVDAALRAIELRDTPACNAAGHLLAIGGKRLRPVCVALAARVGRGFVPAARELAIAVELVHAATLLHDDVVDLGERRRGAETARRIYGNAASIYGGDWLLVDALARIRRVDIDGALDGILDVLREMLLAESLQLENRGVVRASERDYFRVVEGKTASLFRWALDVGARAGGVAPRARDALARFGDRLGVAFQLTDDLLDVAGTAAFGKQLFADLHEGKMTYPLLLAIARDEALAALLEERCRDDDPLLDAELERVVAAALRDTGALADATRLARSLADEAVACLDEVDAGAARDALAGVAIALVERRR